MSTFADELTQSKSRSSNPDTPQTTPPAETPPELDLNNGLNASPAAPTEEPAEVTDTNTPETLTPQETKPSAKVRIGAQEFSSVEDAIAYAQELELAVLQNDAFKAGAESAKPKDDSPETPKRTILDDIEDQLFENPKEAIQKLTEHLTKQIHADIDKTAKTNAQVQELWRQFYSDNADLAAHNEVVEYVLQKHWGEVKDLPLERAKSVVADKTRKLLGGYKNSAAPSETLQSKAAVVAPSSATPAPQAKKPVQTALDFITQVNKHRKREVSASN